MRLSLVPLEISLLLRDTSASTAAETAAVVASGLAAPPLAVLAVAASEAEGSSLEVAASGGDAAGAGDAPGAAGDVPGDGGDGERIAESFLLTSDCVKGESGRERCE